MRRFAVLCALVLSACGGNQLTGTWAAADVPFAFGSVALTLDPTVTFDDKGNALVKLVAHQGAIAITATADGTFTSTSTQITLTLPKAISAKDGNGTTQTATTHDGMQCITIAGAELCLPTPQTNPYAVVGDKLTWTVNYKVATGDVSPLGLTLTKSK